jgi:hypothetical protein
LEITNYTVEITETLQRQITIEAGSPEEALELVRLSYDNSDYILDAEHFLGADFALINEETEEL